MTQDETRKIESYLQKKFGNRQISLRMRKQTEDSVEVLLAGEFIGIIYKDDEDDDTSYTFTMAILDIDLDDA